VSYAILYQVPDPVAYVTQADAPVDVLALLAESAVRDVVGGQTLARMLVTGGAAKTPISEAALQTARDQLQAALEALQLGVIVKRLEIRGAQLPAPVLQAVKEGERQEQSGVKTLRETQAAATDNLIKAHQLAAKLQDESAAYARAVEASAQAVRNAGDALDPAQAQQALADQALAWRQQYPLVFMSAADLQARIQPKAATRPATPADSGKVTAPASPDVTDAWRDRDLMRSRDRIDRPGSGS
jgi:regulator of protease activity HflC (stomatin/prohibitin superfamily)